MQGLMARVRVALAVAVAWLVWSAAPALASTYTVTNLDDSGAGSLRQAITNANSDNSPPTVVDFASGLTGLLSLTSGTLAITHNMTIEGPGPAALELDGDQVEILSVSASSNVAISGLGFAGGGAPSAGGAIDNAGTLSVSDAVFDHDSAAGPASGLDGDGGAIYSSGTLTVSGSTFTDNSAGGAGGSADATGLGSGGAIYSAGSTTITGSTFTGNSAGGDGGAGGDSGDGLGGAIDVGPSGSLVLTNSTLTANTAGGALGGGTESGVGSGGAIGIENNATATLTADTIDANGLGSAGGSGGGIDNAGTASITATIVARNFDASNCFNSGAMSSRDSLEGPAPETSCGFDLPSADPRLGALSTNGGPTETQQPASASPAIGAVKSPSDCPATDQRGAPRPQGGCDVGAYELEAPVIGAASASSVTTTSASLVASIANPDPFAVTSVQFIYDTSTNYGNTTPWQVVPAGAAPGTYTASLGGLSPGTLYHFRVVAMNSDGIVLGPDEQFTTASPPAYPPPSPPAPSSVFTFGKAGVAAGGSITLPVLAPGAGRFTAKATFTTTRTVITHRRGRRVVKHVTTTFTYGTATIASTGPGTFKLVLGLRPLAAKELKLLGSRPVTISVTFVPTGGMAHSESKNLTVKRNRKGKFS